MKATRILIMSLVVAMVAVAAPAPAAADWWPPSKWFSGEPKAEALDALTSFSQEAVVLIEQDKYDEFAATCVQPCDADEPIDVADVDAKFIEDLFRMRETLRADLRRVSPKTVQISEDLRSARIKSVTGNFTEFVKVNDKWLVANSTFPWMPPAGTVKSEQPTVAVPKVAAAKQIPVKAATSVRSK